MSILAGLKDRKIVRWALVDQNIDGLRKAGLDMATEGERPGRFSLR
jgi:hypothetical protein